MAIKESIAELLEENPGEYISGSQIALNLGVTRAAVWKGIQALEADGYRVDASPNRGYRLSDESDPISASLIKKYLGKLAGTFTVDAFPSVDSTNLVIKKDARQLSQWHTVVSGAQTAGRGRLGRSFYSPSDSGLYMSVLLRPSLPADEASSVTSAAAVAVCQAIEEAAGVSPSIKWVNDVFLNGKKVCGILTEASVDMESGTLEYAILGVGINVYEPAGGFPEDISHIAGAVATARTRNLRCRLAAGFLRNFFNIYGQLPSGPFVEEYRHRSFLIGSDIYVIRGGVRTPAHVLDVDSSCQLLVRYADGRQEALSSGEVSVRPINSEDTKYLPEEKE